jgi:hypothetical protein
MTRSLEVERLAKKSTPSGCEPLTLSDVHDGFVLRDLSGWLTCHLFRSPALAPALAAGSVCGWVQVPSASALDAWHRIRGLGRRRRVP